MDRTDGRATRDRMWRGYDGRAMAPVAAAAAAVSLVLLTGRWYLDSLSDVADRVGSLALFAADAVVWATVVGVWLYRTITYTYRLTGRAVHVDKGFRWPPEPPVWLADVATVRVGGGPAGRWLGVGRVDVVTHRGRVVAMPGVRHPHGFADAIRKAAAAGR